jgi:hypothetical protein
MVECREAILLAITFHFLELIGIHLGRFDRSQPRFAVYTGLFASALDERPSYPSSGTESVMIFYFRRKDSAFANVPCPGV